jgi:LysM domain
MLGVVAGLAGLSGFAGSLALSATAGVLRRWQQRGEVSFDDLVVCCAVLVVTLTFGWLGVGALLTLGTEVLRRTHTAAGRLARRMTPSLLRRLLAGACGAAVLTGPAVSTTASAAPADHAHVRPADHAGPSSPRPEALPVPDRPVPAPRRRVRVRVRRGDTLWAIAARSLRPDASNADVAAWWPQWFRHNRGLIGPDPDLIHPGTRLRVPPRPH